MMTSPSVADAASADANVAEAFERVADRFVRESAAEGVVGGSLYFLQDGHVLGRRFFGFENRETRKPIDEDTIYHWASITKTMTAIGVMQLVERGLLDLDDSVVKYLPELRKVHNPFGPMEQVTLLHLLTHSSGFRSPTWPYTGDEPWHPPPTRWSQLIAMLPYTKLHFEPGSQYAYSNPGTSFLGQIIEVVTGDDIEVYIDKNVLMPLGMKRSYFDVTPWYLRAHRSHSYKVDGDAVTDLGPEFDTGITTGNGGWNAPIPDVIRYLNYWLGIGEGDHYDDVLPRPVLESMWRPRFETDYDDSVDERMAESFFTIDARGADGKSRHYIGHTGSQAGFRAFVYIHQPTRSAAIMAVNSTVPDTPRPLVFNTRRALFEDVFPLLED